MKKYRIKLSMNGLDKEPQSWYRENTEQTKRMICTSCMKRSIYTSSYNRFKQEMTFATLSRPDLHLRRLMETGGKYHL